jgi:hypothetical protein
MVVVAGCRFCWLPGDPLEDGNANPEPVLPHAWRMSRCIDAQM